MARGTSAPVVRGFRPIGGVGSNLPYSPLTMPAVAEWFDIGRLSAGVVGTLTGQKAGWSLTAAGAARPTASQTSFNTSFPGLTFDGVANILAGSANFSAWSGIWICGAFVDATAASSVIAELTSNVTTQDGGLEVGVNATAGTVAGNARGTTNFGGADAPETLAAPCVITVCLDTSLSSGCRFIRKNGTALTLTTRTNTCGAGNFANSTLNLGARSGALLPWAGVLGRDLIVGIGNAQDANVTAAEIFVAKRSGL